MRVLMIEDDRKLCVLIRDVLQEEGILIDLVYDGDTGLEPALRDVYDVIVVDWMFT